MVTSARYPISPIFILISSKRKALLETFSLLFQKLFMQGYGGNLSKAYLKANMLAGEAVSNIRTVAAFCAENKILDLYARELVEPSRRSFSRGQIAGIFYGISQFFIFSSYGLALWYVALASLGPTKKKKKCSQYICSFNIPIHLCYFKVSCYTLKYMNCKQVSVCKECLKIHQE